jgi:hypothetical protein
MQFSIFFPGSFSAPEVPLPLVFFQHRPHLLIQTPVDPVQPGGHILVDAGFAQSKLSCRRPNGSPLFYNEIAQFTGTVFHNLCQRRHTPLENGYVFPVQDMRQKSFVNFLLFDKNLLTSAYRTDKILINH